MSDSAVLGGDLVRRVMKSRPAAAGLVRSADPVGRVLARSGPLFLLAVVELAGCYASHERGDMLAPGCAARPGVCCGDALCALGSEVCLYDCFGGAADLPRCIPSPLRPGLGCSGYAVVASCDGPEDCTPGNVCNAIVADATAGAHCMTLDLPASGPTICHTDADCVLGGTCRPDDRGFTPYPNCGL